MYNNKFQLRPAQPADFQAVLDLIIAHDVAVLGFPDYTEDDLRSEWEKPHFDLSTDAWVATTATGRLVGFGEVWWRELHVRLASDFYVQPGLGDPMEQAVTDALFARAQGRIQELLAATPAGTPVKLRQFLAHDREPLVQRLLETNGFAVVRHFWRMEIALSAPPAAPVWPTNVTLRTFDPTQDATAVHAAVQEAFADHWEHTDQSLAEWSTLNLARGDFDPTLWFLALDGAEIAGVALCSPDPNGGWVRSLSVRRPWRRQGLGLALLQQAFQAFYARGERSVGLAVDASSLTGATRLYERAGMAVRAQFDLFEKIVSAA
jgi:GNAT superfamily N-acetyltransferase